MRRIKKDKIRRFSYCFGKSTNTLIGSSIPQVQRRTTERIPDLECFKGPTKSLFQNNCYSRPIKSKNVCIYQSEARIFLPENAVNYES